ncbi:3-deoxy-7-phosphoheptulonate synthase class II [Sphingosinicella sp. CPCC 101087]|uniref:3-deoxy-7-phosphoheptulonate synthase class II n=1 Tax=Sphingosinicella sp. CPCC 101087 TaxID=2497754 RepID=UPI00101DC018|nr:3-deoxy-7-phosphoheptulonate synthase class II [Sphingosinicella sp. CPCC 101087]
MSWTPASWRERPARQMPSYPDLGALAQVESRLASAAPLARVADIRRLSGLIAEASAGRAFLLQGGDCAESFAEFGANKVRTVFNLLLEMAAMLSADGGREVVTVARIAGQFAKPRSAATETVGEITLPAYRGDIVNGAAFDPLSRTPDPERMLQAHRQSKVTIELLHAFSAAAYADLGAIRLSAQARLGLGSERGRWGEEAPQPRVFTSHEALLLHYEQALTRWDEESESWWATSGHMLWLGDRTRQIDGAHVEYASGVSNPIGLKCGPSLSADELLRLIDRLDPDNRPGRLVLIGRFGAKAAADHLPALMRATRQAGSQALWAIDPMHGNTVTAGGFKTRFLGDIVAEMTRFFDIADSQGVHAGGVHLELTGDDVTECLGGSLPLCEADLPRRYLTHCDPRLNETQALDLAAEAARLMRRRTRPASHAA